MNNDVFITCAVTGAGETVDKHPAIPVTPQQIADAAIEAARAGAAIAHIHVRDPKTGKGSRDPALYREVVERIRASGIDVVINLTAGMGGDVVFGRWRGAAAARRGRHRHGRARRERLVHVERAAAGDLHARLRHDEFFGRRLRDDQHARDPCGPWPRASRRWACGRSWRFSTPGTWCSSSS